MSLSKLLLLIAVSATLWIKPVVSQNTATFSTADELHIRQAVRVVKEAILKEDVGVLLRQISDQGLVCTDTNYSSTRIRAFLENKKSHLYMSLFDSKRFSAECGSGYPSQYPAISEQEFLRTADDSMVIVRLDPDWAQVTLTSRNVRHYPREWSLHRDNGKWKLAGNSWIIGRCACG
jgi:hypothetical protein